VRNLALRLGWFVVYFNGAFSVTRLYSVDDGIIEWWSLGKDLVESGRGQILRYYPGIRLEGLQKTTKNLNQDRGSPGPRIEPGTSRIRSRSVNHSTTTFGVWRGKICKKYKQFWPAVLFVVISAIGGGGGITEWYRYRISYPKPLGPDTFRKFSDFGMVVRGIADPSGCAV
jgi:hypothetical protein